MAKIQTRFDRLLDLTQQLVRAEAASLAACDARAALPPGSSRARVTTANARWARAAEHRDRALQSLALEISAHPSLKTAEEAV